GITVNVGAELQTQGNLTIGNEPLTINGQGRANEIQTVTLTNATAGTFDLQLGGQTATLAFDAAALDVQNALNALPSIGGIGGTVSVTRTAYNDGSNRVVFTITFGRRFGDASFGLNLPALVVDATNLTGTAAVAIVNQGGSLTNTGTVKGPG